MCLQDQNAKLEGWGIPDADWASWNEFQRHLSEKFHRNENSLDRFVRQVGALSVIKEPFKSNFMPQAARVLLAIGMIADDLYFVEKNNKEDDHIPKYVKNSMIQVSDVTTLVVPLCITLQNRILKFKSSKIQPTATLRAVDGAVGKSGRTAAANAVDSQRSINVSKLKNKARNAPKKRALEIDNDAAIAGSHPRSKRARALPETPDRSTPGDSYAGVPLTDTATRRSGRKRTATTKGQELKYLPSLLPVVDD